MKQDLKSTLAGRILFFDIAALIGAAVVWMLIFGTTVHLGDLALMIVGSIVVTTFMVIGAHWGLIVKYKQSDKR